MTVLLNSTGVVQMGLYFAMISFVYHNYFQFLLVTRQSLKIKELMSRSHGWSVLDC